MWDFLTSPNFEYGGSSCRTNRAFARTEEDQSQSEWFDYFANKVPVISSFGTACIPVTCRIYRDSEIALILFLNASRQFPVVRLLLRKCLYGSLQRDALKKVYLLSIHEEPFFTIILFIWVSVTIATIIMFVSSVIRLWMRIGSLNKRVGPFRIDLRALWYIITHIGLVLVVERDLWRCKGVSERRDRAVAHGEGVLLARLRFSLLGGESRDLHSHTNRHAIRKLTSQNYKQKGRTWSINIEIRDRNALVTNYILSNCDVLYTYHFHYFIFVVVDEFWGRGSWIIQRSLAYTTLNTEDVKTKPWISP